MSDVTHLLSLELISQKNLTQEFERIQKEYSPTGFPFFLDAIVETNTPIVREYEIINRLPDSKFPNGSHWLGFFDGSPGILKSDELFKNFSDEIEKIVGAKKSMWEEGVGYKFHREKPFSINEAVEYMVKYSEIEFIKRVFLWPRYNNNNYPDLIKDLQI